MAGDMLRTESVVFARPDYPSIVRAQAIASGTARPLKGGRGAMHYDRGHPSRSFTGPVPRAQNVDAALAAISVPAGNVHYRPPDIQDAAIPTENLGSLAVFQYNRMIQQQNR